MNSCSSEPDTTTVDLNFSLTYEGSPLVAFEHFSYPLGYDVFFTKYSLYLSDIILHGNEENYKLSEVEFIDLLTGVTSVAAASEGKSILYTGVPAGIYNAISFNIGVPTSVNATAPASYDSNNPLSNNGEYWVGWSSYIFNKIEGKYDSDDDGDLESGIALHIGSDQAFREVSINTILDLTSSSEKINVNFDLADILNINGVYYNLSETPQIHHIGLLPLALPILDNTVKTLTVIEE